MPLPPTVPIRCHRQLLAGLLALFLTWSCPGLGQSLILPQALVSVQNGVVSVGTALANDTYLPGLGWTSGTEAPPPLLTETGIVVPAAVLAGLGLDLPRIAEVRFGGSEAPRIVVDLLGPTDRAAIAGLTREGLLEEGAELRLLLPPLALPVEPPDPYFGVELTLQATSEGTLLTLTGPALGYRVFTLADPLRLVIDVVPQGDVADVVPEERQLMPGVTYRTFPAANGVGTSRVHLLEIAPGLGEFRVVGGGPEPRPLSELAAGAFAAINAGYFDTETFSAIGLLKIGHGLLSLPSRNRASVGFGGSDVVIDRLAAQVDVRLGGMLFSGTQDGSDFTVHAQPGALVGSPRKGVIVVQQGRVVSNTTGPRTVPEGGFAIVYRPDLRPLALVDADATAGFEVRFHPEVFSRLPYAVEAGPLLVREGRAAYAPETESFERGRRILDAYTQQAGIGVRADGTVLLLVAEVMRAEDLVPLFVALGAEAAMRLDSGSSATLLAAGEVLNGSRERRLVSAIVYVPGPP